VRPLRSAVGVNGRGGLALLVLLLLALIAPARATRGGAGGRPAGQLQRVAPGEGRAAMGERPVHSRFTLHASRFFRLAPHSFRQRRPGNFELTAGLGGYILVLH
jgi:hypothetical protein